MSLVFLIGMPAAGKTFWGRAWAAQHGWSFADLDEQIESFAEMPVADIFEGVGEEGFRKIESHLLEQIIEGSGRVNTIIATGGGTPAFDQNLATMLKAGCVVYLKARVKTILSNLKSAAQPRPLLSSISEEAIDALLNARRSFYEQVHQTVEVEKIGGATFAQILKACTNRH